MTALNVLLVPITNEIKLISSLRRLIRSTYIDIFDYVLAHGSVGTNEIISFSDFDGLLIVKDEYFDTPILDSFIYDSMKLIYQFDPLQHHQWFLIKSSEMLNYKGVLPVETLAYSKLIYPNKSKNIIIKPFHHRSLLEPFDNLNLSLHNKLRRQWKPSNIYQLKSFLSEIMLLPTVYYAAKYGKAVFKGDSFKLVIDDFGPDEWHVIQMASDIRLNWNYSLNYIQRFIMTKPSPLFRQFTKRWIAPQIPLNTKQLLDENFYSSLINLLTTMKKMIDNDTVN